MVVTRYLIWIIITITISIIVFWADKCSQREPPIIRGGRGGGDIGHDKVIFQVFYYSPEFLHIEIDGSIILQTLPKL